MKIIFKLLFLAHNQAQKVTASNFSQELTADWLLKTYTADKPLKKAAFSERVAGLF